ncbi:hypothetical protein [Shewanella sp. NIFS-20-20]|uniref:hypothetical protein n=1 Tax=Shewanella sp. NIFS-20-20 TaxID=2853806 RepID=UPI001C49778A|nr:hypothetical protein [Shewanella sp. NIFS-20-20]MBV7316956.1 hypothetical protein [Shewanella sp. NIFS-20-20]
MLKRICALSLLCVSQFSMAAEIKEGSSIAATGLLDQHEQVQQINQDSRYLLFSRGMKGGEVIQAAFEQSEALANSKQVLYVADISGMPGLISKFVAIPRMQDLPYAVALDLEGVQTVDFPVEKDKATIITLNNLVVTNIQFVDSSEQIIAAVKL